MAKRDFEKLRHAPRPISAGTGYGQSNSVTAPATIAPTPYAPRPKWCIRCGTEFTYHGAEWRPVVRCCDDCRVDLEHEATLNKIDPNLADDVLYAAITGIAAAEKKIHECSAAAQVARDEGRDGEALRQRGRMVRASIDKAAIIARSRA